VTISERVNRGNVVFLMIIRDMIILDALHKGTGKRTTTGRVEGSRERGHCGGIVDNLKNENVIDG